MYFFFFFFFQAEDGIRDKLVTGVQTCALPISAEATRLTLPQRTSPTANTPGSEVSSRYGERSSGHRAAARSSGVRSHPVLMKPLASSATRPFSQLVLASAPVIRNTCLIC